MRSRTALESTKETLSSLYDYFVEGIVEGIFVDEREADEEDVSVGVAECSESFVIILAGSVPVDNSFLSPYHIASLTGFLSYSRVAM